MEKFYNEKHVNKGRKNKSCSLCGKNIPVGISHWSIPNVNMDCTITLCEDCYKNCPDNMETEDLEKKIYRN